MILTKFANLHTFLEAEGYKISQTEEMGKNYSVPYDEDLVTVTYRLDKVYSSNEVKVLVCKITRRMLKVYVIVSNALYQIDHYKYFVSLNHIENGVHISVNNLNNVGPQRTYFFNNSDEFIHYKDDHHNEWEKSWGVEFPFTRLDVELQRVLNVN
jgi:ribosomal protein L36